MATPATIRPPAVAPEVTPAPPAPPTAAVVGPAAPTVLSALNWNEMFGPWVRGRHNFRPVVEAALAKARSRR